MNHSLSRTATLSALALVAPLALADGHTPDFWGALKVGAEYRMMEEEDTAKGGFPNHFEVQDAYSSVGISGEQKVTETMTAFYTYSVYLNAADGEFGKSRQTAWYGKGVRREHNVSKVGLKDSWGSVSTGRLWNAYYNRITWTTDRFNSAWTGFDTYSSFQTDRTLAYHSPSFSGLDFGLNLVQGGGDSPNADTRIIFGTTYATDAFSVSFAYDDQGEDGDESNDLVAVAAETTMGALRVGFKYETAGKGNGYVTKSNGEAEDAVLMGLIVEYTMNNHAFRVHYATGDYPGYLPVNTDDNDATKHGEGSQMGFGYSQAVTDHLLYFAEYHTSEDYCAYELSAGTAAAGVDTGCSVVSTGVHLSF